MWFKKKEEIVFSENITAWQLKNMILEYFEEVDKYFYIQSTPMNHYKSCEKWCNRKNYEDNQYQVIYEEAYVELCEPYGLQKKILFDVAIKKRYGIKVHYYYANDNICILKGIYKSLVAKYENDIKKIKNQQQEQQIKINKIEKLKKLKEEQKKDKIFQEYIKLGCV